MRHIRCRLAFDNGVLNHLTEKLGSRFKSVAATFIVTAIVLTAGGTLLWTGIAQSQDGTASTPMPRQHLLGGNATIYNTTENAFGQPAPVLERTDQLNFFVGNSFFNQNWVTAPASTTARDGLGPLFVSRSCSGCHFKDGRGRPPEFIDEVPTGFLMRLSLRERSLDGSHLPEPTYGSQFQPRAILDVLPEGEIHLDYVLITGTYGDGTPYELRQPVYQLTNLNYGDLHPEVMLSPRVANQMIGLGLLEAIPESTLLALADPTDRDGDGISGRPNWVWDLVNNRMSIGRFGWKANQPNLMQQVASAFNGDIGITTGLLPDQNCTSAQIDCEQAIDGGQPEISDDDFLKVVLYSAALAVPAQRNPDDPMVQRGYALFIEAQCATCHVPTLQTGIHPTIPGFSHQTIHPYTNLLLHDMGEGLADNRPDFEASGTEWRTPPLWGIGLFETVNKHTYYLHDGRARNLAEAILWHGGEAEASREAFRMMSAEQRSALIAFLRSL